MWTNIPNRCNKGGRNSKKGEKDAKIVKEK